MGPHEFFVTVEEGDVRTVHRVTVPDDFSLDWAADEVPELVDEVRTRLA